MYANPYKTDTPASHYQEVELQGLPAAEDSLHRTVCSYMIVMGPMLQQRQMLTPIDKIVVKRSGVVI